MTAAMPAMSPAFCALAQAFGRAREAELVEDERVVRRRAVERDHACATSPATRPLLVGVADGGEQRHEHRELATVATGAPAPSARLGSSVSA